MRCYEGACSDSKTLDGRSLPTCSPPCGSVMCSYTRASAEHACRRGIAWREGIALWTEGGTLRRRHSAEEEADCGYDETGRASAGPGSPRVHKGAWVVVYLCPPSSRPHMRVSNGRGCGTILKRINWKGPDEVGWGVEAVAPIHSADRLPNDKMFSTAAPPICASPTRRGGGKGGKKNKVDSARARACKREREPVDGESATSPPTVPTPENVRGPAISNSHRAVPLIRRGRMTMAQEDPSGRNQRFAPRLQPP